MYMHVKAFEYMIKAILYLATWNLWLKGKKWEVSI
jgi:hypothetical protein